MTGGPVRSLDCGPAQAQPGPVAGVPRPAGPKDQGRIWATPMHAGQPGPLNNDRPNAGSVVDLFIFLFIQYLRITASRKILHI